MISVTLFENIARVKEKIIQACARCGRKPEEITLVAVSKGFSLPSIQAAQKAGLHAFGENRIQEAELKIRGAGTGVEWHFIGHLQSNKAGKALELGFEMIQSVDGIKLAEALSQRTDRLKGKTSQKILLEINIAKESQKSGVLPEEAREVMEKLRSLKGIETVGIMCMGPRRESIRPYFQKAKKIWEELKKGNPEMKILSMGMSADFETAIEEGSSMVRIGRAIFGDRE